MKEHEKKAILNIFLDELKKHKKLPTEKRLKESKEWGSIFQTIFWKEQLKQEFVSLITENYKSRIEKSSTKMWEIISRLYSQNKELFDSFFLLNLLDKQTTKEFQEEGRKIQKIIQDGEEEHVWRMESWKYRDFSSSVSDKYYEYVRTFFPYYSLIWVTIRKI